MGIGGNNVGTVRWRRVGRDEQEFTMNRCSVKGLPDYSRQPL